jgi:nucleoside-diphosphate-sugar epimerase
MLSQDCNQYIINSEEKILVTGANGFIGSRVVRTLLSYGFKRVRCFTRPTSRSGSLEDIVKKFNRVGIEIIKGNLLSREDCRIAADGVSIIYHLAAGIDKSFPGCFSNSVVTTRNILDAAIEKQTLKRFINVSSLAVYSNEEIPHGGLLDETCKVDTKLVERYDPYAYGKAKQDQVVVDYAAKGLPYVTLRPGVVYGPGKTSIPGRVGIDTFGIFLHLGGLNTLPLSYIENCAEAIVLAGIKKGVGNEVLNIVDDDLPTSSEFLYQYKTNVRKFKSINVSYRLFYIFSYLWENYAKWSKGQLPPAFNRKRCTVYWKGNQYSNQKIKKMLEWEPRVTMEEGLNLYFEYCRKLEKNHA